MDEPSAVFLELVCAYGKSQVLQVAATLGLADHLATPKTSHELAELTTTDRDALERLLGALTTMQIVTASADGTYALTAVGRECLAADSVASLRALALYFSHPVCWQTWQQLLYSVKTGRSAFPHVFGTTAWEYRAQHPELNALFNAAMRTFAGKHKESAATRYDFSQIETIVDVGGGNGTLLAGLLAKHAHLRGVLLDLPWVIDGARSVLEAAGVADRCEVVAGDFFETIPSGGDLYVMRAIIHNWDNEAAIRILRRCRSVMGPRARLLLLEHLKRPGAMRTRFWPDFLDLHMLVTLGGGERSTEQFAALFAAADLRLSRVVEVPDNDDLIEAEIN